MIFNKETYMRTPVVLICGQAGTNTVAGNSTLVNTFVNGANETAVPAASNLPGKHSFFRQVDYIGGVKDSGDTWWQGWTCGLTAGSSC
jgi:hypothetical protein